MININHFGGGGVLVAFGGVLLGGALTWLTQYQLARRAERKERRLLLATKLEEAHEYILNARRQNSHLQMIMLNVLRGTGTLQEPSPAPLDRLMTLLEIYTPSLTALHERVRAASDARSDLLIQFRDAEPKEPAARMEMAERFVATLGEVDLAFLALERAVRELARGLTADK